MIDLLIKFFLPIYILITFRNPRNAFLLWILLSPLSTAPIFPLPYLIPDLTFDRIAMGTIFLIFVFRNEYKPWIPIKLNKLEKWMIAFIFILTIELLFTYRPKDASERFLTIFDSFGIPFLSYFFVKSFLIGNGNFNEKFFDNLVKTIIIVGVYVALIGIYEGLTLNDIQPAPESEFSRTVGGGLRIGGGIARVNGPFFTPETFGVVLSIIFFVVFYKQDMWPQMKEEARLLKKAAHIFVTITLLIGIYLNMFRSVWLGLFLGFAFRFPLIPRKRLKMFLLSIFIIVIVAINLEFFVSRDVYKSRVVQSGTFYSRVGAYLYTLRAFSENPLTGIGFTRLYKYIEHAQIRGDIIYFRNVRSALQAHNTFLCLLAENGIMGFIPYFFILWSITHYIKLYYLATANSQERKWCIAVIGIFLAYLTPLFFSTTGYYSKVNILFFTVIGMMMASLEKFHAEK